MSTVLSPFLLIRSPYNICSDWPAQHTQCLHQLPLDEKENAHKIVQKYTIGIHGSFPREVPPPLTCCSKFLTINRGGYGKGISFIGTILSYFILLFYFISFAIKTAYSYNTIIMRRKRKKSTQYNGRVSATATPITAGPKIKT